LSRFSADQQVDRDTLVSSGIIKSKNKPVKLLGHGEISTALNVRVAAFSKSARDKIEAAGGKVEVA
jgi:large subunit ribosomal protein L15